MIDPTYALDRFRMLSEDRSLTIGERAIAAYYASHTEESLKYLGAAGTHIDRTDDGSLRPVGASGIEQIKIRSHEGRQFVLLIGQGGEERLKAVILHEPGGSLTRVDDHDDDYRAMDRLHESEHSATRLKSPAV
jgi:hypothetical protein